MRVIVLLLAVVAGSIQPLYAQDGQQAQLIEGIHRPLDQILDVYVRDGFVYYNALRSERARLDAYVRSLDGPSAIRQATGSKEEQLAFWINAYNAFVLQTVVNNFPIRGKAADYPASSIRQIPGAFDRQTFRVAGKTLTLDAIERDVIAPLGDPRALLALGRGSIGGGRLRSEAYDPKRIDKQLDDVASEAMSRRETARVDVMNNQVSVTPLFSWREAAFVKAYADKAPTVYNQRSPMERAVLGLIQPYLVGSEAEFLEKNQFKVVFHNFDWRLNDLSNRPPDGN